MFAQQSQQSLQRADEPSSTYWKLIKCGEHGLSTFWLFDNLFILRRCIEFTYPGCGIDFYPIDGEPDCDCNVFVDGEIVFRIIEVEQGIIQEVQALL